MNIVALCVAAVVGSAVFPPRRYRFWWKWSRPIFWLSLISILVINGLFGILGVLVAEAAKWHPWHETSFNDIAFAMLGLALVRIHLPGVDIERRDSSIDALNIILRWIVGLLDEVAEGRIRASLSLLENEQMRELVSYILTREVIPDGSMDSQDRAIEVRRMAEADSRLLRQDSAAWAEMLAWSVLQSRTRLLVLTTLR